MKKKEEKKEVGMEKKEECATERKPGGDKPSRRWCFTLYPEKLPWHKADLNPKEMLDAAKNLILSGVPGVRGLLISLEKGDTKEHPHLQGYMECMGAKRFAALRHGIGCGVHLEIARATREANFDYILHEGEHKDKGELMGSCVYGTWPDQSGTERGAYDIAVGMILEGRSIISVAKELKGAILPQIGNLHRLEVAIQQASVTDLTYLRKTEIERDEWLRYQRMQEDVPF